MEKSNLMRARVTISGRVQGVCFRLCTKDESDRLKINGWVRNLPTGQVEAVFEGEKNRIDELIRWCHQGPPAAKVSKVEIAWEPYKEDFPDFRIV